MKGAAETTNPAAAVDAVKLVAPEQLEIETGGPSGQPARRYARAVAIAAVVLVVLAGAVVAVVLTLRPPAGSGIRVPEQFSISFSASGIGEGSENPGVSTPYTGKVHKELAADGSTWQLTGVVEYTQHDSRTVVTLVNNRAYYTTTNTTTGQQSSSGCITRDDLPPYADLQAAFDSATPLSAQEDVVDHLEAKCANKDKFVIAWAGQTYVFCALQGADGASYEFVGEEFAADLFDMREGGAAVPVTVPTDAAGAALSCPELASASSTATSRRLRAEEPLTERDIEDAEWYLSATHHARRARRLGSVNKCVFMHGLGHDKNEPPSTSFTSYWGNVHKHANCNQFVFLKRDTKNVAWDDPALLSAFCSQAGGPTIQNTYVFSHSMGSLIVAGALQSGTCSLASSSKWFQVEGPLAGAKAADYVTRVCQEGGVVKALLNIAGFCGGDSIDSLKTSRSNARISYSSLVSTVRNNADGVMCGKSAWGLNTWLSAGFAIVEKIIGFSVKSDAIVGFSSCDTGAPGSFSGSYKKSIYAPKINHFDGTCRNGNGWWGSDRKPCKWFDRMT